MGFLSGRISFIRFRVTGKRQKLFGAEHLENLAAHAIGKSRRAASDGVEVGWTGGDHILDTRFDLAKNIVNDMLHFCIGVDQNKIPADLLHAYTQVELHGVAAGNPSGLPSARQRREARAMAKERLEKEAADGRFLRRKAYPLLWDVRSNELFVGTTSATVLDRLLTLFQQTFGFGFEPMSAGRQAYFLAETRRQTRGVDDASPSAFLSSQALSALAWAPDEASRDFLGNEFLLWLWHTLEEETDAIKLQDDSEAAIMAARSLTLECPRGQSGKESFQADVPIRLPEARRAIQAGKWPRKMGLNLVRHGQSYELTIQGETLSVTGAKLPQSEGTEERTRQEERIDSFRHLIETLDLVYDAYCEVRLGSQWAKKLAHMQQWLKRDERRHLAVAE